MNEFGLIHIYCGDGKGKTTAAMGLLLRACGDGKRVLVTQFLKDGSSSEIKMLHTIPNVTVKVVSKSFGFYKNMSDEQRQEAKLLYSHLLKEVIAEASNFDLLIFDEIISAYTYQLIQQEDLLEFLRQKPKYLEVVMTGRNPEQTLLEFADYVTEMKKIKHPYDKNILARQGIEY